MRQALILMMALILSAVSAAASYYKPTTYTYSYSTSYYKPTYTYTYSYSYNYYTPGSTVYVSGGNGGGAGGLIVFCCIFVPIFLIVLCCGNKGGHHDGYVAHTETVTVVQHNTANMAPTVYPPGFVPMMPAMCNYGHPMNWMNSCPYPPPATGANCDMCKRDIPVQAGFLHCYPCGSDICQSCGAPRIGVPPMH